MLGKIAEANSNVRRRNIGKAGLYSYTQESYRSKSGAVTWVFEGFLTYLEISSLLFLLMEYSSSRLKIEHWLRLLLRRNVIAPSPLEMCEYVLGRGYSKRRNTNG